MDLLKKSRGFPTMLVFSKISQNYFCIVKVMDQIYGSRDNDWLLVYGGLAAIGQCGHFKTREVIEIARREEEGGRSLLGFSRMASIGGEAMEMATRRHSTEVVGGAPMERWFQT
jgi:hypothetical protein